MKKKKFKKILPVSIAALCAICLLQVIVVLSAAASSDDVSKSDVNVSDSQTILFPNVEGTIDHLQEVVISKNDGLSALDVAPPYNGNYRSELSDLGKEIYDSFADQYAGNQSNESFSAEYENGVQFKPTIQNGKIVQNAAYEAACDEFELSAYTAIVAFMYDNPDIFWLGSMGYMYGGSYDSSTGMVKINEATFYPIEYYTGAFSEATAFRNGVNNAVGDIVSDLPAGADRYDIVKGIHDYICENASYDYNAANIGGEDYTYAHTAAPLFTRETKTFVCEGYAKAFKVLCGRFNIPSVLVAGYGVSGGSSGAHMWNYAKMEDGNWYAVDATWDDSSSYIYDTYLLVGSQTEVFGGDLFSEDHQPDGNFTVTPTMTFTFPTLNSTAYARTTVSCSHGTSYAQVQNVTTATCQNYGYSGDTVCSQCSTTLKTGATIAKVPHTFSSYTSNNNATCYRNCTETATCDYCDATDTRAIENTKLPHSFTTYYSMGDATCTANGTKVAMCDNDGCYEYDIIEDEGSMLPHTVKRYTYNKDATCTSDGTKSGTCSKCKNVITITAEGTMLPHTFTNYTSNNDATCSKDGTKTAKCDYCDATDTVTDEDSALPHNYGAWSKLNEEYHYRTCTDCSYVDTDPHEGGEASYSQGAVCTICSGEYGDMLPAEVKLNITEITLLKGESFDVISFKYPSDSARSITWASSDENIATVDQNGKITAVAKGKATVTATMDGGNTASVKVTTIDSVKTPTTSIVVNKPTYTLTIKRSKPNPTISLSAKIKGNTVGKLWYSSDINVATVNKSGKVTAVGKGTATISCRTADGKVIGECAIVVNNYRIESTNMRENIVYVNVGDDCKVTLDQTVNAGEVTWKSSNAKCAAIDADGTVHAYKKGTVTITATTPDKNKDTCKLVIVKPSDGITLKSAKANVYVGKTVSLKASLTTKGSNDPIFWSSSNPAIATVTSKGVVKGVKQGVVTITAYTFNGKKTTALVTVMTRAAEIKFTEVTPALNMGGETGIFKVEVSNPTDSNDTVTWTTSNKRIIEIKKVSKDGRTIIIKSGIKGTATITARTGSGKRITYKVTSVNQAATNITLNKTEADIYVGQTVALKASKIEPRGCNDVIIWKSLNEDIATVTPNGKVKGISQGTVTIDATSFGGVTNSVTITVRTKATSIDVNKTTETITVGSSTELSITAIAPDGCNDKITWTTSNKRVATVTPSSDGRSATVEGLKKGTVTITVKAGSGKYKKVKIIVTE